jgi:glycosyltransferase involved in cell wall biosynthesis
MKILFLNYEYPPLGGGAGNATKYLLQEYAKHEDLSVDLVTSAIDEEFVESRINGKVGILRLPIGKNGKNYQKQSIRDLLVYSWRAYFFSRAQLKKGESYDAIHAFFSVPCGVLAMLLSWEFRIPYIVSLRGADVPGYAERFTFLYGFLRPIVRLVWKYARCVISNSEGLRQLALKTKPDQNISVIYNGVDTEFFYPDEGKRNPKMTTILCASRLTRRKGFIYAIEAFSKISQKYNTIRMIIAGGDGNATEELKRYVEQLNLTKRITFFGEYNHNSLLKLQQSSNIFLFPSLNEGMSNSMLEAMASGLPVIMTPTGGAQELVEEGKNGFLVGFRDAEDIAKKLEMLIQDKDLCKEMGRESRRRAQTLSWSSVALEYKNRYAQSISKNEK